MTQHQWLPPCTQEQYKEIWKQRKDFLPAIEEVCRRHSIAPTEIKIFDSGSNLVAQVTPNLIVKLYFPFIREQFESERAVLQAIENQLPVETPHLHFAGEIDNWPYVIMSIVRGTSIGHIWPTLSFENKKSLISELGKLIQAFHNIPIKNLRGVIRDEWGTFLDRQLSNCVEQHHKTSLPEKLIAEIPTFLPKDKNEFWNGHISLISGDFTHEHILVSEVNGIWKTTGLIDFADCMIGQPEYDFSAAAMFIVNGEPGLMRELFLSYGYDEEAINQKFIRQLMWLTLLHRFANFKVQIKTANWENRFNHLAEIESFIWNTDYL